MERNCPDNMLIRRIKIHLILVVVITGLALACPPAMGGESKEPALWGVVVGLRVADIPFEANVSTVNDVIPLIYYDDNGRFFMRGLDAGFRFYRSNTWQFSALARYRFFDIPQEYQNEIRESGVDLGGQLTYRFSKHFHTDVEVLSDSHGNVHANAVPTFEFESGNWEIKPYVRLRWKSAGFNNRYYGLGIESPGSAFDLMAGADLRYHVYRNLYLVGQATLTMLDSSTSNLEFIKRSSQGTLFFGVGFFNDKKKPAGRTLKSKPYIRLAHGWATPSNLGEIVKGDWQSDPYNNQLTSVFVGIPVADDLFGIPIATYFTPGIVLHSSSEVQDTIAEYVVAIKFYYTFKWPTMWRFGFAEGLSYATEIPYIEKVEMEEKGYRPSELLNFLDFSLDVSLGHLFKVDSLKDLWLGYSIHHRSGIFQKSSAFGRIAGGSNYNTVYLQYHW